jgi:hypothetical protein
VSQVFNESRESGGSAAAGIVTVSDRTDEERRMRVWNGPRPSIENPQIVKVCAKNLEKIFSTWIASLGNATESDTH